MEHKVHVNTLFNSLSYRIADALFDPGDYWEGWCEAKYVLLTHAHFDHIYGLNNLLDFAPDIRVITNTEGRDMLLDPRANLSFYHESPFTFSVPERIEVISDGDIMDIGRNLQAKAVFTPGHNPSCISWIIDDMIFTGDSLIPGVKTVTNLPKGNRKQAVQSELLIHQLSTGKTIFPGHKI